MMSIEENALFIKNPTPQVRKQCSSNSGNCSSNHTTYFLIVFPVEVFHSYADCAYILFRFSPH